MPAPFIEPTDIQDVFFQVFYRDPSLYSLLGEHMYTGLDLETVKTRLGTSSVASLLNVSYISDIQEPKHGSAIHHLCTGRGIIQIDVASKESDAAASHIAALVRSKIYNDVSISLAGEIYDLTVEDPVILLSYNESIAAWVAVVRASVEYDTEGE